MVFDTSYLVRLYLQDVGYEKVRDLAESTHAIAIAWHGHAEIIAAFHRIYREGRVNKKAYSDLVDQFLADTSNSLYQWLEFNENVRVRFVSYFRTAPATLFLRAADALHLASAAEYGYKEIYSHDKHLLKAAPFFGLSGKNVI
ncbi:MAG: type II toxin-antitoxin system VapC family toxin [Verrucomicrobiae bacterium]|nr:type II toxin-antitoxin system VapC family toxin [Verrucomicrobiae bacterium]